MNLDLLVFCQSVLIGLKLFGVINCSWWVVFLPILAIPAYLILYSLIGVLLITVIRRLK